MNFSEVVQEVIDITARQDKKSQIENAVNTVLSLVIFKASFVRDLVESTLNAAPVQNVFSGVVDLAALSNFRKLKYLKVTGVNKFMSSRQPQGVIVQGIIVRDIYWIAGTNLNWVSSIAVKTLEIGYFVYPPKLTDAAPIHWFLDTAPNVIIDLAAARIFRSIGDSKSASDHEGSGAQLYITVKSDLESNVEAEAV